MGRVTWFIAVGVVVMAIAVAGVSLKTAWAGPSDDQVVDSTVRTESKAPPLTEVDGKVRLSDAQWRERLTDKEFHVLREQGTERAFTGQFWAHKDAGVYACSGCGHPLFESDAKFRSGTGWPSFTQPVGEGAVTTHRDVTLGMVRTEVTCGRCDGHLGHVFDDGPAPTGLRYCINSVALDFEPTSSTE